MPKYELECMYCGHKWEENLWSGFSQNLHRKCEHCEDKFIKVKELKKEENLYYPDEEVDNDKK